MQIVQNLNGAVWCWQFVHFPSSFGESILQIMMVFFRILGFYASSFMMKVISFTSLCHKNTKSLHNLNSIYFFCTSLFLAFTNEITGQMKKFTQIWNVLHKHVLQVCVFSRSAKIISVLSYTYNILSQYYLAFYTRVALVGRLPI